MSFSRIFTEWSRGKLIRIPLVNFPIGIQTATTTIYSEPECLIAHLVRMQIFAAVASSRFCSCFST